jgi:hypothetical protein
MTINERKKCFKRSLDDRRCNTAAALRRLMHSPTMRELLHGRNSSL